MTAATTALLFLLSSLSLFHVSISSDLILEPTASPTVTETNAPSALSPWGGCVDPDNPDDADIVTIGQQHSVCLVLGPKGDWGRGATYVRYVFRPTADEYSRFYLPNSYQDIVYGQPANGGNGSPLRGTVTVHTAAQNMLSFLRVYYDVETDRIYPFLTAVLDVSHGNIVGIAWDNACVFCSPELCEENMYNFQGVAASDLEVSSPSKGCYFTREQCDKIDADGETDCDLTLYVVWTGTDSRDKSFQSAGNRFSQFPAGLLKQSLASHLPDLNFTGFFGSDSDNGGTTADDTTGDDVTQAVITTEDSAEVDQSAG